MENDNSFVLPVHQVPEILHIMTFHALGTIAISKRENNHFRPFARQYFVKYDRAFVLPAHLTRDILLLMFSNLWMCAILDFEVRMIPKLKTNHLSKYVCHAEISGK